MPRSWFADPGSAASALRSQAATAWEFGSQTALQDAGLLYFSELCFSKDMNASERELLWQTWLCAIQEVFNGHLNKWEPWLHYELAFVLFIKNELGKDDLIRSQYNFRIDKQFLPFHASKRWNQEKKNKTMMMRMLTMIMIPYCNPTVWLFGLCFSCHRVYPLPP